ncbi:hypothetical protein SLEP1_g10189 [Rubroshorea leprosula]|uniref:Uncharacterized protein n=1 Tax=Rubroshorea leprosula TaxID=152421 RepID=A0AAV5IGR0_9ROSI|nr:hypothetical protein SLEP1_g10189 [Rubroshorea leprosula]
MKKKENIMALNKAVAVFSIWFACSMLLAISASAADALVPWSGHVPSPAPATRPSLETPLSAPAPKTSAPSAIASLQKVMTGPIGVALSFLALKEVAGNLSHFLPSVFQMMTLKCYCISVFSIQFCSIAVWMLPTMCFFVINLSAPADTSAPSPAGPSPAPTPSTQTPSPPAGHTPAPPTSSASPLASFPAVMSGLIGVALSFFVLKEVA